MPKANELHRRRIVKLEGGFYTVVQTSMKTPSARGAATLYKVRFEHIQTHQKLEKTFKWDDWIDDADLDKRKVQFLYRDADSFVFMKEEDYTQHSLDANDLAEQSPWLTEGLEGILGLFVEGRCIGIEIPHTVELEIVETAPTLKGATATAQTKPAILSTGAEVQVPEYLSTGDKIRVNTETGKFVSRV